MSRQTPTSRRSPSILVTDVRYQTTNPAPFVSRRLNSVSVDSLLSNTSEVPSAQRRATPRRQSAVSTSNYGTNAHRSRMAGGARRWDDGAASGNGGDASQTMATASTSRSHSHSGEITERTPLTTSKSAQKKTMKPVPRLSKPLPSRQSKQSQRLVMIPDPTTEEAASTETEPHPEEGETHRVTSYLISEGVQLKRTAKFLKLHHRARVRLYDEALFADYLLPLLPGDGMNFRLQSSIGDNRTMERMIDISEQGDHHFEYFSATSETPEADPSEPQDFSPRPDTLKTYKGSRLNNSNSEQSHETKTVKVIEDEQELSHKCQIDKFLSHAELFVFNYGVVVFWNFTEAQEKQVLADLCIGADDLVINPCSDQEIQSEELRFAYTLGDSAKPRIFNDLIMLNSNSHMLKLAMSHAMAQSTILCGFEDRMQAHLKDVSGVPKTLALTGKLGMNREQLLKISGRLFKLRVDVNLSSNVLDIPEFFWDSEPSLFPLFNALREYLEIDQRVLVLNERQSVFLELTSILSDSIAEYNMDRITIIVIWLIVLSICVSLTEIGVRFLILRRAES